MLRPRRMKTQSDLSAAWLAVDVRRILGVLSPHGFDTGALADALSAAYPSADVRVAGDGMIALEHDLGEVKLTRAGAAWSVS